MGISSTKNVFSSSTTNGIVVINRAAFIILYFIFYLAHNRANLIHIIKSSALCIKSETIKV
ncbi:hypothetical protein EH204_13370 [Pectobacterium carotovorum subsp. carotovorum]|nr:hypothetical protein EH204_13370 [Pectobacterium carotovorum subsp. carotovorum]